MPDSPFHPQSLIEDWKWVTNGEVDHLLRQLSTGAGDAISWTKYLRKQGLTPGRVRLVIEQLTLRPLAEKKFANAARMFFDRKLLEQATDQRLADYKATRFKEATSIIDVCCGLGGDLVSLAKLKPATGVDADPIACLIAEANCRANGVHAEVVVSSAEQFQFRPDTWIHVDPDRRASGHRSTKLDYFSPEIEFLKQLVINHSNVAIKLAPATRLPREWRECERQWLGDRHECKQQIVWFGDTAKNHGCKSATAIDRHGSVLFEWVEEVEGRCEFSSEIGAFLYEPHPTIIAGRMIDSIANEFGLKRIASDIQYLTGAESGHTALSRFKVLETCRIDKRDVTACLNRHNCGHLEIKKRGVDHDLIARFGKLKLDGTQSLVLVLTRWHDRHMAIICKRC